MLKLFTWTCIMMIAVAPAMGQSLSNKSAGELRQLLQKSKQDSNRILMLHELGRTYLKQELTDKGVYLMDTAIEIFNHAARLSDTLQLTHLKYISMELLGRAYLAKGEIAEGKKILVEVASIYHAKGDFDKEGLVWLWLAKRVPMTEPENYAYIDTCFQKALILFKQTHNLEQEAQVRTHHGRFLYTIGNADLAEKELLQALDIRNQTGSKEVTGINLLLSTIWRYRGSYEKALSYAIKSVDNVERNNDTALADWAYGELALVYDELGRAEESSKWYRKALDKRIEQKAHWENIFRTEGFLIRQLIKLNKSRIALALTDSLATVYPPGTLFEKALISQNYACCFDALKQYTEAEKYFLAVIKYYNEIPSLNKEISYIARIDIGRFYVQHRQFKKAAVYLDTVLAHIKDNRLPDQKELFQLLFTTDSTLGNYANAIRDLQQYQVLNDSIFNDKKSKQIEELTIQYETEKKEQSIRLLENEKRLQQSKLTDVQNTKSWILGVAILLIIITGLLVNYARLKILTNKKLQVQQKQIEKKNDSLHRLVEEKEWLVKEIHHRVKNNFHIVMGLLRTQSAYLQSEEAIQAVAESQQRIQAMSLVHQKLYQSDNLSAINMADYIHELVDSLKDSLHNSQRIKFHLDIDPVKMSVSYSIPIGLILNEAITNSLKHGFRDQQEGNITITLKSQPQNHFLLSVKDNGVGLPASFNSENQASMGMRLMRGLSEDIDATFQVNNNGGTTIVLDFICEDASY